MEKPLLRRTRFVCVSDTHNSSPLNGSFKLPKGDVLIHAGDLTNQGTLTELDKSLSWIETAEFEVKIVTAGNHDLTLDAEFYAQHGPHFHNQYLQNSVDCINRIKNSSSITYLEHEHREIKLMAHSGPRTTFKVFGSPYSPSRGLWAFGYKPLQNITAMNLATEVLPAAKIFGKCSGECGPDYTCVATCTKVEAWKG
jgi:hypothetical protein